MKAYLWMNLTGALINTEIFSMSFGSDPAARARDIRFVLPTSCPHLPTLMRVFAAGTMIKEAVVTCVGSDSRGRTVAYCKYRLKDVLISNITVTEELAELGLNFEMIEQTYRQGQE